MSSVVETSFFKRFFSQRSSIEKTKIDALEFFKKTVLKIQNLIRVIFPIVFFILCSMYVIDFAPTRFLFAAAIALLIKMKSEPDNVVITTANQALNTIGTIGAFLEKATCPVCDPSFYLSAYISGFAFGNSSYNLIRKYFPIAK